VAKEFRYLRIVKVTTAVYRGFGRKPKPPSYTLLCRARVSPHTSYYYLARTCVFVKQSPPPIPCGAQPVRLHAPLIPKLRGHFAKFLKKPSSVALVLLYQPTSVGFSTVTLKLICFFLEISQLFNLHDLNPAIIL